MSRLLKIAFLLSAFCLAIYTQFIFIAQIPGLHFDEAWQGVYAHRIAFEEGFFPLRAMNSYTFAVVHYPLALAFKIFEPSILVMRSFYAILNLSALGLLVLAMLRLNKPVAAFFFVVIWAVLPFFVHTHRFYIEMTGLFSFCAALALYALVSFHDYPKRSQLLLISALLIGTFSHVLFVTFAIALFFVMALHGVRAKKVVQIYAIALVFIAVRMGLELKKVSPFLMAGLALSVLLTVSLNKTFWIKNLAMRVLPLISFISPPFLVIFLFLMWNGPWSYAQATGHVSLWWLPFNAIWFLFFFFSQKKWTLQKSVPANETDRAWIAFTVSLLACYAMVYKPAPRYFVVPMIFAALWTSFLLETAFKKRSRLVAFGSLFLLMFNFSFFSAGYLNRFQTEPGTNEPFRIGPFNDSARDFRPFQKVFSWAEQLGCAKTLDWVEDDRFGIPLKFLKYTAANSAKTCPWHEKQLFFSHIPNFSPERKFSERLNAGESIGHPVYGLRLLAHKKEWGDLAIWIRDFY